MIKNELMTKILNDYDKYIDALKTTHTDIFNSYKQRLLYNVNFIPKKIVTDYEKGEKESFVRLIFVLETETKISSSLLKEDEVKLWLDFLQQNELTKPFFNEKVNLYDFETNKKETLKISDIVEDSKKLKYVLIEMDKYRRKEFYDCPPCYIVGYHT